jgi:hypothetical protein
MFEQGRYYVGDLCYVLPEVWDEVCGLIFDKNGQPINGEHYLKDGRKFAIYCTKYGDGTYRDGQGRGYDVDSGTIGCILEDDIDMKQDRNCIDGGNIIDFPRDFITGDNKDGQLLFGHILIETGDEIGDFDED